MCNGVYNISVETTQNCSWCNVSVWNMNVGRTFTKMRLYCWNRVFVIIFKHEYNNYKYTKGSI